MSHSLAELLRGLSMPASRATFAAPLADHEAPQGVRLAEGPAPLCVVGIPSTVALCGPHQYIEFAKPLRGARDVYALQVPGFVTGEQLPANAAVAVEVQAEAALRCAAGAPMVLTGYSSGGTFAYAIAAHLEARGSEVAAVALIDAYTFATTRRDSLQTRALLTKMFDDRELRRFLTATRLSAMAWYTRLFGALELAPVAAPTLQVQPCEPMPGMGEDEQWRSAWPHPHETIEVPGDHWTMMMDDAASTAAAVERWIADRLEGAG